jgi:hypothetical protein
MIVALSGTVGLTRFAIRQGDCQGQAVQVQDEDSGQGRKRIREPEAVQPVKRRRKQYETSIIFSSISVAWTLSSSARLIQTYIPTLSPTIGTHGCA